MELNRNSTFDLTPREREVLAELVHGRATKAIAKLLIISEATVTNHLHHIYRKLGVKSRVEAAIWALTNGIER
jgi:two-component system, NarL family, nitrate/nitrite response regulator NarL